MSEKYKNNQVEADQDVKDMVAEADTGARAPSGLSAKVLSGSVSSSGC
jgi:hypothetical protein